MRDTGRKASLDDMWKRVDNRGDHPIASHRMDQKPAPFLKWRKWSKIFRRMCVTIVWGCTAQSGWLLVPPGTPSRSSLLIVRQTAPSTCLMSAFAPLLLSGWRKETERSKHQSHKGPSDACSGAPAWNTASLAEWASKSPTQSYS